METPDLDAWLARPRPAPMEETTHVRMMLEELRAQVECAFEKDNYVVPPGVFEAMRDNGVIFAAMAKIHIEWISILEPFEGPPPFGTQLLSGPPERAPWADEALLAAWDYTCWAHRHGRDYLYVPDDTSARI